jgi:hypothetical protein
MKMKLKKVIIPLLGLSALSAAALGVGATIHAQDKTSESAVAQANKKTLSQVLANEYKATTKFSLGEDFNYDGLVVTAVYSNSTQKVLEKGMYTVDARNFNKNKQGTYTILLFMLKVHLELQLSIMLLFHQLQKIQNHIYLVLKLHFQRLCTN